MERFWSKAEQVPGGCWNWTADRDSQGYGRFKLDGKKVRAHRLSLTWASGPSPAGKPDALHSCDNPSCVNPSHLAWGSASENQKQKAERGRAARGESNGRSKLTQADVDQIRDLYLSGTGATHRKLGKAFGVSHILIGQIVRYEIWRNQCES